MGAAEGHVKDKLRVLLLDEPFGMLDSLMRMELQDVLLELWGATRRPR